MRFKIYLAISIVAFLIAIGLFLSDNNYWISSLVVSIYFILKNPTK